MLKGTSGGGGMGMEVVKDEAELKEVYQRTVDMSKVRFELSLCMSSNPTS